MDRVAAPGPGWHLFVPKLLSVLRRGYGAADLRADLVAGLTVAVVALPLAMALAIASGTTPEKGLHTAIIAGGLISLLGGSRVQIGGPTAAFVPVVFATIQQFGYGGMILCTLLAGLMLIAGGLLRLGTLMKYMPKPVITGFTAGIAVSIFSGQVPDLLGLKLTHLPGDFLARWREYAAHAGSLNAWACALSFTGIAALLAMRRFAPRAPGFLIVVAAGAVAASLFALPIETIGMRFPQGIPSSLPQFDFPHIPFERTRELLPASFTIAFLAGVESLLSAVVADGMIGGRHRSNCELVAQGVANAASALFGGLPATGALARTATNVRAGARSPLAGIFHALFLLAFMLLFARWMAFVPLAALAAVLAVVAYNMAEIEAFRHLMRGPRGDRAVLLLTFALTVVFDLTVAIEAGVVLAAFLFMHRMAGVVEVGQHTSLIEPDVDDLAQPRGEEQRASLPPGVEAFQIAGPLFFAVANRLDDVLDALAEKPRVFILRLRLVPMIDASGVTALAQFLDRCGRMGIRVVLSGVREQPRDVLARMHVLEHPALADVAPDFPGALARARELVQAGPR
ncbi:MAG TPA: SulP family inorganic anion transporter [Xanthomonadales bacterium]|nr:SulP family inorganic anion transporter [Xanthomonadales bacterium]